MANINQVQLPDGSQYNIKDEVSGYATENYVQNQISGISKSTIGLGNVDNTSDANKPVSTAQQTALDGKVNTSMVAHVQTTLTADMRYVVGDEFIYQGNLYKATAIIASGGTITIGTNAELADSLTEQINKIGQNRRYVVISDSYGAGRGSQTPFTTYLETMLSGSDYYAYSEGSMGIYNVGESGHNAEGLLTAHSADISSHDTITDIIFALGINDYNATAANINSAFASLDTYLKSEYPNAKIWFAWIGNSYAVGRTALLTAYQNYLANIRTYEYSFCEGVQNIMHNSKLFISDGVHPTSDGGEEIAKGIYTCVSGNEYRYFVINTATLTPTTGTASAPIEMIDGDNFTVIFPDTYNSGSLAFTTGEISFGTMSNNIIKGVDSMLRTVSTAYSTAASFPLSVDVILTSSSLKIRSTAFNSKTVAGLQLNKFVLTGATMMA